LQSNCQRLCANARRWQCAQRSATYQNLTSIKKELFVKVTTLLSAALALAFSSAASALCPWNTSFDSTLKFCTDANNAFGPFTRAMTTNCTNGGNGAACTGTVTVYYNGTNVTGTAVSVQRWGKSLATSLRGTGACPTGSIVSATYDGRCVESTTSFGTEVYGPFPQNYIDACRAAPISAGNACYLNRWAANVYNSVKNQVAPAPAAANWKLPMPSGFTSSEWCVCRSFGSSPHIGWDLVNNAASMVSVAIEAGKITRGPTLNGGCGWELELTDRFNTVWYYRHMNRPNLSNGQSLAAGATVGLHQDYPVTSGPDRCGSGPHLHLERLSAGFFNDSAVSKNCTGTATSCNYDPRKPFPAFKALAASDSNTVNVVDKVPAELAPELDAAAIARNQVCRIDPASYTLEGADALAELAAAPSALNVSLKATPVVGAAGYSATILALSAGYAGNRENLCKTGSCVTSVTLYAQTADGRYARVLSDSTVRNTAVALSAESAFCAPADATGRYVVKLTGRDGSAYRIDVDTQANDARAGRPDTTAKF
jgi:hypothetical protein